MRCAAVTLATGLETEQALDATSNAVVLRLDDSGPSGLIDELDEMLAVNCAHELVIHAIHRPASCYSACKITNTSTAIATVRLKAATTYAAMTATRRQ